MNFQQLHERLRLEIWRRIDRGTLTSSLLARQTGLRSSHISNFLHRKRRLSLSSLDRVLAAQMLSIDDLLLEHSGSLSAVDRDSELTTVPVVSHSSAMSAPTILPRLVLDTVHFAAGYFDRFPPRRSVSRRTWERFVAVRLTASEALPMNPILQSNAVAVIDRHYNSLVPWNASQSNLYAVRAGALVVFRYVTFEVDRLVLRPRNLSYPVELLDLGPNEAPSEPIVGRVCVCISEL
jgi:hypothetical protein